MSREPDRKPKKTEEADEKVAQPHPNPPPCAGGPENVPLQKSWRADVWKDTQRIIDVHQGFVGQDGVFRPVITEGIRDRVTKYKNAGKAGPRKAKFKKTVIRVANMDCIEGAVELVQQGSNPMLMDAASRQYFGGGYTQGSRAQEEELCRRSALATTVHPLQRQMYPLEPASGIYCPPIPFFRQGPAQNYALSAQVSHIAVGIVAAYSKPRLTDGGKRLSEEPAQGTRGMIRTYFQMALDHGHTSIVCVPLGCGAFKNPALHVAEIFMQELAGEFKGCFETVLFSVLDDHNAYHSYNPLGNYAAFGISALTVLAKEMSPPTTAKNNNAAAVASAGGGEGEEPRVHEEAVGQQHAHKDSHGFETVVEVLGPNRELMTIPMLQERAEYMKSRVSRTGGNRHLTAPKKKAA